MSSPSRYRGARTAARGMSLPGGSSGSNRRKLQASFIPAMVRQSGYGQSNRASPRRMLNDDDGRWPEDFSALS